jgi:Fe-S cluster biogenesis protein NfuA
VPAASSLRSVGDRIEALLAELRTITDPRARSTSEELVRLLLELYGGGIERMMEIVDESPLGGELFGRFAADDLVASLLLLHGLHPDDAETRVARALDRVRPFLASHGGDVTVLGIAGDVIRLRLEGSCHGCPSSTVTMKLAIEKAIEEAAPELIRIEVEGVAEPGAAEPLPDGLVRIGRQCIAEAESHG